MCVSRSSDVKYLLYKINVLLGLFLKRDRVDFFVVHVTKTAITACVTIY